MGNGLKEKETDLESLQAKMESIMLGNGKKGKWTDMV